MKHKATIIRLPESVLQQLKYRGLQERKSLAQLVRDAIEEAYGISAEENTASDISSDPIFQIVGKVKSGIRDGSVNHNREIYGLDS